MQLLQSGVSQSLQVARWLNPFATSEAIDCSLLLIVEGKQRSSMFHVDTLYYKNGVHYVYFLDVCASSCTALNCLLLGRLRCLSCKSTSTLRPKFLLISDVANSVRHVIILQPLSDCGSPWVVVAFAGY